MSCDRCLAFRDPRCLTWDQDVPPDHRVAGCDKRLPDDDPKAFEEAFEHARTTKELFYLTHRWIVKEVPDTTWKAFANREAQLAGKGDKPVSFHFRMERVYRWCIEKLPWHRRGSVKIRIESVADACGIDVTQAEECLAELYKEGTLKMEKTRKRESLFWMEAP